MYKSLLVLVFLICFQSDTTELSWNANYKLTWADFKGKPNLNTDAAATTASGITFSYSIKNASTRGVIGFETSVYAHFYPEYSWYKKGVVSKHILGHEQLHFDITELNTRYLKAKIATLKPNVNSAKMLNILYNEANKALAKMQKQYDKETNFSINKEEQSKWNFFVRKELKRLKKFKAQA